MISGNKKVFAIKWDITEAYVNQNQMALGFFVLYLNGKKFGVDEPDATMLACSFNEVKQRIARRGHHDAGFALNVKPFQIAEAVYESFYDSVNEYNSFFGIPVSDFINNVSVKRLLWAPDGDAAFDDGSYVIHIDCGNFVRLIAFRCDEYRKVEGESLVEVLMDSEMFYSTLKKWMKEFYLKWHHSTKI